MEEKRLTRRQAIIRRRIFLGLVALILALIIFLVVFIITAITGDSDKSKGNENSDVTSSAVSDNDSGEDLSSTTSTPKTESQTSSADESSSESEVYGVDRLKLSADFGNLLLVNADNPLPENYDSDVRKDLVEIDAKYRNNNYVTKIHKDVYPYITAMVAAAQKDGVDLKVWSPFRSYADQKVLFQNKVNSVGGDEEKAATVVARPGTSEHNTGLCADFNMAKAAFADTPMYRWMVENAEDYGFVMRYREDKQPITGVIHETWHWRFVGVNHAKQMNKLDMCLEEYVEYLENKKGETNKKAD